MKIWIKFLKKKNKRREKGKEKVCSCIVLDEEKSRQNCYTTSPAHLATFYFSSRYLISRLIFKPYPWANRPEYNEKSANLQHYQQPCYSFWRIPSILRVVSERNDWKKVLFKLHRFFSCRKILMIQFFDLILDFSKETHPNVYSSGALRLVNRTFK